MSYFIYMECYLPTSTTLPVHKILGWTRTCPPLRRSQPPISTADPNRRSQPPISTADLNLKRLTLVAEAEREAGVTAKRVAGIGLVVRDVNEIDHANAVRRDWQSDVPVIFPFDERDTPVSIWVAVGVWGGE